MDELRTAIEELQQQVAGLKQTLAMGSNIARTEVDELDRRAGVIADAFKAIDKRKPAKDE